MVDDAVDHSRRPLIIDEDQPPVRELRVRRGHNRLPLVGIAKTRNKRRAPSGSNGRTPSSSMTSSTARPMCNPLPEPGPKQVWRAHARFLALAGLDWVGSDVSSGSRRFQGRGLTPLFATLPSKSALTCGLISIWPSIFCCAVQIVRHNPLALSAQFSMLTALKIQQPFGPLLIAHRQLQGPCLRKPFPISRLHRKEFSKVKLPRITQ